MQRPAFNVNLWRKTSRKYPYPILRDTLRALWDSHPETVKKKYDEVEQEIQLIVPRSHIQEREKYWLLDELFHVYMKKVLNYHVTTTALVKDGVDTQIFRNGTF